MHQGHGCGCKFNGGLLNSTIYTSYPSTDPGKHANLRTVKLYGTSCAAWDSIPDTPWVDSCNKTSVDMCSKGGNWYAE